ncbi:S8 family peptidase [Chitinophaga niabensis]|uniref:S8 family peptidase n=1 Tax=Chitinophaga niabensis TaxID=536979 RepID=UPI001F2F13A0|nr:S8 family peptidase [Chitinophaga niabensis]
MYFLLTLCIWAIIAPSATIAQSRRFVILSEDTSYQRGASSFYVVKFSAFPGESVLHRLQLVRSINALEHIVKQLPADTTVKVWRANNNWKASDALLNKLEALQPEDSIELMVQPHTVLRVAKKDWQTFIAQPSIQFADIPRSPTTEIMINTANATLNTITTLQQRIPALQGEGMRVSLKETLYDTLDLDLLQRYVPGSLAATVIAPHATIMATLIAGAGNSAPSGTGVAKKAQLASSDFKNLFPDAVPYFSQNNIALQNHSYGVGIENNYGLEAAAYDEQIFNTDTLLHVFSSGNIGVQTPNAGLYNGITGFANLSGTFKQAKNLLVIGGTDGDNNIPVASSKGPAFDGRVKPELVAYGEDGTSGAAALVSGVGLLLQEQYKLAFQHIPPASLLKAILINSADDIDHPGVDHSSGFGALNAWQAVNTITQQRFAAAHVTNGSVYTQTLNVPEAAYALKVTMCYTDPPATVNSARALINDLDLWVTDAAGNRYEPWILSTAPHLDSLRKNARTGRDSLNNVEQVYVALPAAGTYTIHVKGYNITTAIQKFHLAWQLTPLLSFDWEPPIAERLQWKTNITGKGNISYSLNNGVSWQPLTTDATVESGRFSWAAPNIFGNVLFKMETASQTFISDPFLLAPSLTLHAGFDCTDSALIYWNKIPGAATYRVYALNGPYMTLYRETRDTLMVLSKAAISTHHFAVSAVNGTEGPRSTAIDYTNQALQCYILSFTADLTDDKRVQLQLQLGSTYKLKSISWEREQERIAGNTTNNSTTYTYIDASPIQGIVYYRAKLETTDGKVMYSDVVPVQVLTNDRYLLFPNPATNVLNVLSRDLGQRTLHIIDGNGRVVKQTLLVNLLQDIPLHGLPAGNYWCVIYGSGRKVFSAKFIKL